ncbi:MAG: NAD(P)-dependent alcohol dehydrogenase [Leptospirales bacterium]|nr:NAD(P)-dependent alcohol dehydrogenase [Leptospirales bacterium]
MHAAFRQDYGGPEVLRVLELPVPELKAGQVLIKVMATTVNRTDCAVLTGKPAIMRLFTGLRRPSNPVTGTDFAGIIERSDAPGFSAGQKVFGFLDTGIPTHAEFVALDTSNVLQMPDVPFEVAAAACEAGHYAYNFTKAAKPRSGQTALVNGAGGGIGSAMLQFLKHAGLTVTAVCRGDQVEKIQGLGADSVINYESEDFTKDSRTYDFVFDAVGKSRFCLCRKIMKAKAMYLSSEPGPYGENLWLPLLTRFSAQRVLFPFPADIPGSLAFLKGLLNERKFKPLIDRTYTLDQVAEAFRYTASGQKTGNVVIALNRSFT